MEGTNLAGAKQNRVSRTMESFDLETACDPWSCLIFEHRIASFDITDDYTRLCFDAFEAHWRTMNIPKLTFHTAIKAEQG